MKIFEGLNLAPAVNRFKQGVTDSMRTVKNDSLTAVDVTQKNMKEGVALKTGNDTNTTGIISSYRSNVLEQLNGIIGALSGGALNTKKITKSVRIGPDGVRLDGIGLLDDVASTSGSRALKMGTAFQKGQLANELNKEFSRLTGLQVGGLITQNGQKFGINKNWRGSAGAEAFRLLGVYTPMNEYIDVSVQAAIRSAVMKKAAEFGMRDLYKNLFNSYPQGMGFYQRDAVLEALSIMITRGDILSIKAVADLLDREGKNVILSKYPNFVEKLFSSFTLDDDVFPENYAELRVVLEELLVDLIGPSWYWRETQFGQALNLIIINSASPDMIKILGTSETLAPLLCSVGFYREGSATVELRRQFPDAPQYAF